MASETTSLESDISFHLQKLTSPNLPQSEVGRQIACLPFEVQRKVIIELWRRKDNENILRYHAEYMKTHGPNAERPYLSRL